MTVYCPHCHRAIDDERKIPQRLTTGARFLGVCGGIADYFRWERLWVRAVFALLLIFAFPAAFIGYFIAALIMEPALPCSYEHN